MGFIHSLSFLSLALIYAFSGNVFALQAPDLTNQDFIEELLIKQKGHVKIQVNEHKVRAEYVEEDNFCPWVHGNRLALEYIVKLCNGDENTRPIPAKILNEDNFFIKVGEGNRGEGKLFNALSSECDNKFGVKYTYQIPYLPGQNFDDGFGYYEEVKLTFFSLFLLVDEKEMTAPLQALRIYSSKGPYGKKGSNKNMPIRAKVSEEVKKMLPERILAELPSLSEHDEIKPFREKGGQIWLFRDGLPITSLPYNAKEDY